MKKFLLFYIVIFSSTMHSQDGMLDTNFGNNGFAITEFSGSSSRGSNIAIQNDGKIIVYGIAYENNNTFYGLVRHLSNGQLDTNFGTGGLVKMPIYGDFYREYYSSIHIQNDQKIIISTTFIGGNEVDYLIMRFLQNGDLDASFGENGMVRTNFAEDNHSSTNLLPNGKIIAAGSTTVNGIASSIFLAQYLPNGDLDTTFGVDGTVIEFVTNEILRVFDVKIQDDGKIVVPYFSKENFVPKFKINRYLPNGQLDTTFGTDGVLTSTITGEIYFATIALLENGKILQCYRSRSQNQQPIELKRLLNNGILDTTFAINGTLEIDNNQLTVFKILEQVDGDLLVFGSLFTFEPFGNFTYRFKADGALDSSFGDSGIASLPFEGSDIILQPDNKIVIAGNTFFYDPIGENFLAARLTNGTLSTPEFELTNVTIFPNPSTGIFTVESNLFSETTTYQITDVLGKTIQIGSFQQGQNQIDLSSAQSGIYFLSTSNHVYRLIKN